MREIKFRAWDEFRKEMIPHKNILSIHFDRRTNKPNLVTHTKDRNAYQEIVAKEFTNEFKILQYTGLKDKNGREIYEGDIVETNGIDGKLKWVFVYTDEDSGVFGGFVPEGINHDYSPVHNDINNCEFMGNIFEDLDLLQL